MRSVDSLKVHCALYFTELSQEGETGKTDWPPVSQNCADPWSMRGGNSFCLGSAGGAQSGPEPGVEGGQPPAEAAAERPHHVRGQGHPGQRPPRHADDEPHQRPGPRDCHGQEREPAHLRPRLPVRPPPPPPPPHLLGGLHRNRVWAYHSGTLCAIEGASCGCNTAFKPSKHEHAPSLVSLFACK